MRKQIQCSVIRTLLLSSAVFVVAGCTPPPPKPVVVKDITPPAPSATESSSEIIKSLPATPVKAEPKRKIEQGPVSELAEVPSVPGEQGSEYVPKLPLPSTEEISALRERANEAEARARIEKSNEVLSKSEIVSLPPIEDKEKIDAASSTQVSSSSSSSAFSSPSALPVPILVTENSSSSGSSFSANPLGNPTPKLPIPDNARVEAGKALLTNEQVKLEMKREETKAHLADPHSRAQLKSKAVTEEKKMKAGGTPFLLEALFISIVLICLVGAMWYRLTHDFSGVRRRKDRE